jgi:membrane associated rhomboid family serine protease
MTTWVLRLIVANVVVMVMTMASPAITRTFTFVPAYILIRPWTVVTYMFLHAGLWHIAFNMIGLFFFGPRLEVELGEKKFLGLYFTSGIMGAIISSVFSFTTPIIGASGAVYGVMLGYAYFWPKDLIYIYGIIPVQSRFLVLFVTIISMYGGISGSTDGVAHFAHLGGFLGGYLFLLAIGRRKFSAPKIESPVAKLPDRSDISRWNGISGESMHPVNREELDRIRSKITADGAGSLTQREIEFLNRFSGE